MSDLSLTSSSVVATAANNSTIVWRKGTAGVAIAPGQPLYLDSATNTLKLADANASAATATVVGVALTGASGSGQPVLYVDYDPSFTHGLATVAAGDVIYLSQTAGAHTKTIGDISSGSGYVTVLGVAISATKMILDPIVSGVLKA